MGVGLAEHHCLDDDMPACAISPHHPAISAVVRFFFETPHTNTRGTSVQTQLACQCMNADCTKIATVALRRPPAPEAALPGANGSCTYQAVAMGGEEGQPPTLYSCVSALMHIGTVDRRPEGPFPLENFEYNVTRFGDSAWSAQGYRNVRAVGRFHWGGSGAGRRTFRAVFLGGLSFDMPVVRRPCFHFGFFSRSAHGDPRASTRPVLS